MHRLRRGRSGRICARAAAAGDCRRRDHALEERDACAARLARVYAELTALIALHAPAVVAIEDVFFSANAKSALKLGQVRGVALLAAANMGLPIAEYAPLSVKSSVVGYGLAKKEQVQFMVARLLELEREPEPADAADALAIAICHIHTAQTLAHQGIVGFRDCGRRLHTAATRVTIDAGHAFAAFPGLRCCCAWRRMPRLRRR